MLIKTHAPEETSQVGRLLGNACRGGETILLEGDLGAGKTTLTQGLAAGLGVSAAVVSPTFIILREYEGRLPLYHFDFYRLEGTGRAVDLEFDDYLSAGGVCVVEWPSSAPELTPDDYLLLTIRTVGPAARELVLAASDARHQALIDALSAALEPVTMNPTTATTATTATATTATTTTLP